MDRLIAPVGKRLLNRTWCLLSTLLTTNFPVFEGIDCEQVALRIRYVGMGIQNGIAETIREGRGHSKRNAVLIATILCAAPNECRRGCPPPVQQDLGGGEVIDYSARQTRVGSFAIHDAPREDGGLPNGQT